MNAPSSALKDRQSFSAATCAHVRDRPNPMTKFSFLRPGPVSAELYVKHLLGTRYIFLYIKLCRKQTFSRSII